MSAPRPPVVWVVGGTDSGGGAGIGADQRAVDAFGLHACPVVAAVTAQNSVAVARIEPLTAALIEAQFDALEADMPPAALKTGLLGSVDAVRAVARRVERLRREHGPLALVVDPVLGATTGARFADREVLAAYRAELLPLADLVTPNRREALALLGENAAGHGDAASVPGLARALRRLGADAVCVTGGDGDGDGGLALDGFDGPHAAGWLALPRLATPHHHGTGCTHASAAASAFALGFVAADAAVLAKMATAHALAHGHAAGAGAGPVRARPGFGADPALLPSMSFGEAPPRHVAPRGVGDSLWGGHRGDAPALAPGGSRRDEGVGNTGRPGTPPLLGLYAVVDGPERVAQVLAAGIRTVQLRMKTPDHPDAAWHAALREAVRESVAACRAAGAELFVNDHWRLARELGAGGVHLGQEDLLALGEAGRRELRGSGLALGVSSHSLWELCRARALAPRYVACGPVWPTLTKAMPWRAQGLGNLAWWRRMAGVPVVAIGGILDAAQVEAAARCGVDGVCVVRALGDDPAASVPALEAALHAGQAQAPAVAPALPHPSLPGPAAAPRSTRP